MRCLWSLWQITGLLYVLTSEDVSTKTWPTDKDTNMAEGDKIEAKLSDSGPCFHGSSVSMYVLCEKECRGNRKARRVER